MLKDFFKAITRYPWLVVAATLSITFSFFHVAQQHLINSDGELVIDTRLDNYIQRDSDAYEFFEKTRQTFGSEEVILLTIEPKEGQGFSYEFFEEIYDFSESIPKEIPQISYILSLTNTPRYRGACAGESYLHFESFGSICESVIEKTRHELQCLQNPPADLENKLSPPEDEELGFDEGPDAGLFDEEEPEMAFDDEEPELAFDEENSESIDHESDALLTDSEEASEAPECTIDIYRKTEEQIRSAAEKSITKAYEELKKSALIQKDLLSTDHQAAGFFISFKSSANPASSVVQEKLRSIIDKIEAKGYNIRYAGQPRQQYEAASVLRQDIQKILPISLLLMVLCLGISFRSIRGIFIPFAVVATGVTWTAGIFSLSGAVLNPVTLILPPLLICVGSAYIIFALNQFYQELKHSHDRTDVVHRMVEHITIPLAVTALTTIAGFAALIFSPIPAIKSMGIFACIGIVCIVLLSLMVVPGILILLPLPKQKPEEKVKEQYLDIFLKKLSSYVGKYPKQFIIFWLIVGVIAFFGLLQVEVNSEATAFKEDSEISQDLKYIENHFAGTDSLRVIFSYPKDPKALQTPETMQGLKRLIAYLQDNHSVLSEIDGVRLDKIYSVVPYLEIKYPNFNQGMTSEGIQKFFDDIDDNGGPRFISTDRQYMQMIIRVKSSGSSAFLDLTKSIEKLIHQELPGIEFELTGSGVLASESANNISRSQIDSVALALVIIFFMLSGLFLSPKMGLTALYPNIVSIAVFFGVLGWAQIPIGVTISVIAAIALGIGVDDTIHFLAHYNENVRKLRNEREASEYTIRQVGRPVTFTTVSLAMGFGIFVISEMETQILFGALVAFTLVICWMADLIFLPSIMMRTKLITAWDYLSLDYGPEFLSKIPLFKGMTIRETKLTTLIGYQTELEPGKVLFNQGDIGHELYIVLEGEIEIFWKGLDHNVTVLNTLQQGAAFGEMGLFRQTERQASARSVDTASTKLLVLTDEVLFGLKKRYPAIASKFFINLAIRLLDSVHQINQKIIDNITNRVSLKNFVKNMEGREIDILILINHIKDKGTLYPEERRSIEKQIYSDHILSPTKLNLLNSLNELVETGVVEEVSHEFPGMLHNLTHKQLQWLIKHYESRTFEPDEMIWEEGSAGNSIMILLEGKLNMMHEPMLPLYPLFKGDAFGLKEALYGQETRSSNVVALEESVVLEIPIEGFIEMQRANKRLAAQLSYNLVSVLSNRLADVTAQFHG